MSPSTSRASGSAAAAVCVVACAVALAAPPPLTAQLQEQGGGSVSDLAFMSGCWRGSFQANGATGTVEERYTPPSENVILGTTRYLLDGRTVQFEFLLIRSDDDGVSMLPYPDGKPSHDAFLLVEVAEGHAVFEALEHDFPKRIIYRRDNGELVARIDGGAGTDGREWRMSGVDCNAP